MNALALVPSPIQVVRMEGKKRQRASSRRGASDEAGAGAGVARSSPNKSSDW